MSALERLLEEGVIDEVLGRIKSGKEADISMVRRGEAILAAKVYKDRATRSFKNNADYKEGRKVRNTRTQRAIDTGGKFGRDSAEDAWKSAEADALYKLVGSGVRVPVPVMFYEGVLLMELVLDENGDTAPRLIDVAVEPAAAMGIYADLVAQIISMLCCDLIHGDLSPYNILAGAEGPTIIDFPQVVSAVHSSRAEFFFLRDFDNVVRFVSSFDPTLAIHRADGRAIWRAYVGRELTPQFVPPPPQAPRREERRFDRPPRDQRARPPQQNQRPPQQAGRSDQQQRDPRFDRGPSNDQRGQFDRGPSDRGPAPQQLARGPARNDQRGPSDRGPARNDQRGPSDRGPARNDQQPQLGRAPGQNDQRGPARNDQRPSDRGPPQNDQRPRFDRGIAQNDQRDQRDRGPAQDDQRGGPQSVPRDQRPPSNQDQRGAQSGPQSPQSDQRGDRGPPQAGQRSFDRGPAQNDQRGPQSDRGLARNDPRGPSDRGPAQTDQRGPRSDRGRRNDQRGPADGGPARNDQRGPPSDRGAARSDQPRDPRFDRGPAPADQRPSNLRTPRPAPSVARSTPPPRSGPRVDPRPPPPSGGHRRRPKRHW